MAKALASSAFHAQVTESEAWSIMHRPKGATLSRQATQASSRREREAEVVAKEEQPSGAGWMVRQAK